MEDTEDLLDTNSPTIHRGYKIYRDRAFGTYSVTKVGKGPLPKTLMGSFQSPKMIVRLIDEFINNK